MTGRSGSGPDQQRPGRAVPELASDRRPCDETKEALERQTATAEILRVISGSITDTQPVFDAIVNSCQRLFNGRTVSLVLPDAGMLKSMSTAYGDFVETESSRPVAPWPLDRDSIGGTCILDSRVIAVPDLAEAVHTSRAQNNLRWNAATGRHCLCL